MKYDPVMAALVRERGPCHPDYYAVRLQEKIIALALEGRVDVRRPRSILLAQVREIIRREREGVASGEAPLREPSDLIAASVEQARLEMKENPVERILRQLAGVRAPRMSRHPRSAGLSAGRSGDPAIIVEHICKRYLVGRQDLLGPCRRQDWATARFELFYRLRTETHLSYKAIGQIAGGRHHTTVLHGVREWCRLNDLPHPDSCIPSHRDNGSRQEAA